MADPTANFTLPELVKNRAANVWLKKPRGQKLIGLGRICTPGVADARNTPARRRLGKQ